jgi:hypothetical protein
VRRAYLAAAALFAALVVGVPLAAGEPPDAPTITSSTPPPPANNNTPTLNGNAATGSTVAIYATIDCSGPSVATGPAEAGTFAIPVSVADNSATTFHATTTKNGETSRCSSAGFLYTEDSPPKPTISGPTSPSPSAAASFTFFATGAVAYQCSLDGAVPSDCTAGSAAYSGLVDGSHTLTVRAQDTLGVLSDASGLTWVIDTTAPDTTLTSGAPDPGSTSATFTFTGSDAGSGVSGFQCSLDHLAFVACVTSITYQNLADGDHSFEVRSVDAAGNVDATPAGRTWTVDTPRPSPTITDSPARLTNRTTASFSFSASPAPDHFECRLDTPTFSACASPQLYSGLRDGSHTYAVRAVSTGGSRGVATQYIWTIDTVAPQTTIASAPSAPSTSSSAGFRFSSSEAGSTFFCRLDASGFAPCTSPKAYAGLGSGTHTFRVQAVDQAGNADASPASYTWTISGVGLPVVDLQPPANVGKIRRNVGYKRLQLRWSKPADSDFDHVGVYVSTSRKTAPRKLVYSGRSQSYTDRRFKNGGYYRYLVVSYDHAKNASGGSSAVVPPSALLRSPRTGSTVRGAPTFRWAAVRGASFYNIQLYQRGSKVLSAWPNRARQRLTKRWSYRGRHFTLRKGIYVWYVWPGFGPKAKSHYGQLLGEGSFRVR